MDDLREKVRERYAEAARHTTQDGGDENAAARQDPRFGAARYDGEAAAISLDATEGSLGCGNPIAVAELHAGEIVLDLGSGVGLDMLLSAKRVGPTGIAYGLDMTAEMLARARANAAASEVDNAVFLKGYIEDIPLPDRCVDVVLSNCVINLSTDKPAVFAELARVLAPDGRVAINDIVAENDLTLTQRRERGSHVGCIAGALSFGEYRSLLAAHGFADVTVTPTHEVAGRMHAAIFRGTRTRD